MRAVERPDELAFVFTAEDFDSAIRDVHTNFPQH